MQGHGGLNGEKLFEASAVFRNAFLERTLFARKIRQCRVTWKSAAANLTRLLNVVFALTFIFFNFLHFHARFEIFQLCDNLLSTNDTALFRKQSINQALFLLSICGL